MMNFGVFIGALLVVIGLITFWLAPRVGPNPIFGVRIGYAFASRKVWDRTNRAGGVLIAAIGGGMIILANVLRWVSVPESRGLSILIGAMMVTLIGGTVFLGLYARRLAQGTVIAHSLVKVEFRWTYLVPILVTFALLIAVAAFYYPMLPRDRIATHFDFNDQPNGWMSRDSLYLFLIGMSLLFVFINALVVFLATREPLIAFTRWGSRWRMLPARGLHFMGIAFGFANLILTYALFDIAWFAQYGVHWMPLGIFLWIILLGFAILIAAYIALAKRERSVS